MVTVSENEVGKLKASLLCNKPLVDNIVIVTSPDDKETQRVCAEQSLSCHVTTALHENGDAFNKGRALSDIQKLLHQEAGGDDSLIMLVDNDICLPSDLWLRAPAEVPKGVLLSATERCMFENPKHYLRGWPATQGRWNFDTMGFLQIYRAHAEAPLYPTSCTTAAESDLIFGRLFEQQTVLPVVVTHLGMAGWSYENHWKGNTDSTDWEAVSSTPPDGVCPCCQKMTQRCLKGKCNPI